MRLLVTADLHFNHTRSGPLARELIKQMNDTGGDVLLVAGDTATSAGDALERCLSLFEFDGPRLFVAGNHELWSRGADSLPIFQDELPRRIRGLGWQWLQGDPFVRDDIAIVGSIGWYDYAFAVPELGIPQRFYEHKLSPGAGARLPEFSHLFDRDDDIPDAAREIVARWNDGRFVRLHRSDSDFLNELLDELRAGLLSVPRARHVVCAIHHVPFEQLLPPRHGAQWDFARAYLGSPRIGALLREFESVRTVVCGHSHFAAETRIGSIRAINIGSGYRSKTFRSIEIG
ncbi:MAG: metallophosphoesterase family protein [Tepidisphaeraceae bacterium]